MTRDCRLRYRAPECVPESARRSWRSPALLQHARRMPAPAPTLADASRRAPSQWTAAIQRRADDSLPDRAAFALPRAAGSGSASGRTGSCTFVRAAANATSGPSASTCSFPVALRRLKCCARALQRRPDLADARHQVLAIELDQHRPASTSWSTSTRRNLMMPLAFDLISTLVIGSISPVATTERASVPRSTVASRDSGMLVGLPK